MEKDKTAVEWLFEKLWDEPKDKFTWYALREKAIKMEKEQLENARPQIISNCNIKNDKKEFLIWLKENHWHVYKDGKWFTSKDHPYIDGKPRKFYTEEQVIERYENK